ncbi:cytochrome c maturation protein CcmE domain-containing protein [Hymenobacter properus]|uniref:Cytochrome c maturation protein CcmE n=1 Tax=Hymenobacter properus TaxID=2791026 RepID=A0A931BJS5_9BACT|nr:cytochrome c maturation protein CcmE [Hymenobacter properus]MBF9143826.1 cytochrome c maturation protein CcmE [Hymenobacter properus]MBR7722639.1 cytochrome c maturation protein CcmE [Microvirga sp. SRT04]
MKKSSLFIIAIIAVAAAIILSTTADASMYVGFGEARARAAEGNTTKVHVVGRLPRDAQKRPVGLEYDPLKDPNYFAFTLVDSTQIAQRVVYNNPKPQDFDASEQVVITGAMKGDVFMADQILLKCPSKYVKKDLEGATASVQ